MLILKRGLQVQAAALLLAGLALVLAPDRVLHGLFGQPALRENAWQRILGVQAICLAALAVLLSRRLGELWWWAWAFELLAVGTAIVAVLNAGLGTGPREPAGLWWLLAAASAALAILLLWGLARTAQENPP
jgi:hypothetical protein